MEAGSELDTRIAHDVLGWREWDEPTGRHWHPPNEDRRIAVLPAFSTDIAAAWQVVEHMRTQGWHYQLYDDLYTQHHLARFEKRHVTKPLTVHERPASTPALAICRAALAALESEVGRA